MKRFPLLINYSFCFLSLLFVGPIAYAQNSTNGILSLPEFSMQVIWDRATWLNMIEDTVLTEDYESDNIGTYDTPYTTSTGILMNGLLGTITMQIIETGLVDGSRSAHFRDFGDHMSFTFPDTMAVSALGFDYYRSENWELHVEDTVISLAPASKGFVGVIFKGGDVTSFVLTSPAFAQGGLSIDNIVYNKSHGIFSSFTNREDWQSNINDVIHTEDFKQEPSSTFTTPYITEGEILMEGVLEPITFQILDNGLIDDSKAPHFRDFGSMMKFSFPDERPVSALGFDFYNGNEAWQLHIEDSVIVLNSEIIPRFIGITIPEGSISSFILTSPSFAQGGISVDNISYVYSKEPIPMPVITDIIDVPMDQGKQVRLSWRKSVYDGEGTEDSVIVEYSVWRKINDPDNKMSEHSIQSSIDIPAHLSKSLPAGEWDFIQKVPAVNQLNYNVICPTLYDSCATNGIHWSVYSVIAHTADPLIYFASNADSGYSIDNLIPHAPENLVASIIENTIKLSWDMVPDEDFDYYVIYRHTESGFVPSEETLYGSTIDTLFIDDDVVAGTTYYYKVATIDFAGNQGTCSEEVQTNITGIEMISNRPTHYALNQNYPNPFNPGTTISFSLAKQGEVRIEIYNTLGQKVVQLLSENLSAGQYKYYWNANDMPSGIYYYTLQASEFRETRRMLLLK